VNCSDNTLGSHIVDAWPNDAYVIHAA